MFRCLLREARNSQQFNRFFVFFCRLLLKWANQTDAAQTAIFPSVLNWTELDWTELNWTVCICRESVYFAVSRFPQLCLMWHVDVELYLLINHKLWQVFCDTFTLPSRRFVFFLDPCNVDIVKRKIRSVALCVSKCPETQLQTYDDLRKFSETNGTRLISALMFTAQISLTLSHLNKYIL